MKQRLFHINRGGDICGDILFGQNLHRQIGQGRFKRRNPMPAAANTPPRHGRILRRAKAIANQNFPRWPQQRQRLWQRLFQRDILKAFRKQAQIKGALGLGVLKGCLMHHRCGRIDAASACQIRRRHHDFHAMAHGDQLFRCLARAAANV
jgi:hypothetical protein